MATCVKRRDGLVFNRIDDEVVLFHLDMEQYYGMNAVGSRIWELLSVPQTTETLCETLAQEFDVDEEVCAEEVRGFLASLKENKLIEEVTLS